MKYLYKFVAVLIFLTSLTTLIADAGTTGKIAGRVTDADTGEPLPFVNVIVMGTNFGAATDMDGYYSIVNVPPGTYRVKASAVGFQSKIVEGVKVNIDLTTDLNFELREKSVELEEDVVVTATRPMVQKDVTATTSIVDDELIKELPVTEVSDVLSLQAGITISAGGAIHVRGGRSGQIAYQIDGVPVTDSYDGSTVVDVNKSAVQELQVVSGAFNAEYGQAMSGVVNLVTKSGGNEFEGSFTTYSGDYISDKTDIYPHISSINPVAIRNIEGSISGPIINDKLFFYTNARYYFNQGYMWGRKEYRPTTRAVEVEGSGGSTYNIEYLNDNPPDEEWVPMNSNERIFGQGKLNYRLGSGINVSYNYIVEDQQYQNYDHGNRLTPDNNLQRFRRSYSNILKINHALSNKTYYTLNLSYYFKEYYHYLYEDIHTGNPQNPTRYVDNDQHPTPPYSFNVGGTNYNRFKRNSGTYLAKLDYSTQYTREINIEFGGVFKQHNLFYNNISLVPKLDENGQRVQPFDVQIPPETSTDHNDYFKKPYEAAAYLQTKIEAFNIILNAGVRFDLFDPNSQVLSDPTDPDIRNPLRPSNQFFDYNNNGVQDEGEPTKTVQDRKEYWYEDAAIKYQISPRFGLAFPITEKGVIHFSYGHFFQLPRYSYLYTNPEFELQTGSSEGGLFGNADLKPQKTVKGEIGVKQQLGDDIAIDVTMFFEDFRNLTGTQNAAILTYNKVKKYYKYSNSDFGFSRGVIFKFEKRFAKGFATNLDYTYSVTKGNASNPTDSYNAVQGGQLPETFIAPLNWDQTHTLNVSVAYNKPGQYGFSLIGNIYSGQPYTPQVNPNTRVKQNAFPRNSGDKPTIFNVDLRTFKDFEIFGNRLSVFLNVYNVFDFDKPTNVYGDTGDPYYSFDLLQARRIDPTLYNNDLQDLYLNPTFFSEPRRVELGFTYNL